MGVRSDNLAENKHKMKDKMAAIQVLGCLIKNPLLLLDPKYPLEVDYFPENFHKNLFTAIEHLIKNKATSISYIDIDNFLSKYKSQHIIFKENKGIEYVQRAQMLAEVDNYGYYYGVLRKMSLLNDLTNLGFDTSVVYDPNIIDPVQMNAMQRQFDEMDIEDIVNFFLNPLNTVKAKYSITSDIEKFKAGVGALDLKESYKVDPEMGLPLNSRKLTTIFSGRRLRTFYLKTSVTNMGKTRMSIADACLSACLEIYDLEQGKWVENTLATPTLIIVTEQEQDEVEPMLWAYVAGVEERHITQNRYKKGEEERVERAIKIIEESPLYYVIISDYDYEDIELIVAEHKQKYGITHVFFDYLHETEKLLSETGKRAGTRNLRTDQVLGMVSSKIKGLAQRLNIHIDTSTQSNDQIKSVLFADQSVIRGARSIADKPDVAYVVMPLSPMDEEFAKSQDNGFSKIPNVVFHVYKIRRGSINKVKVWSYFDYGTLRTYDCYVTKANNELINVPDTEVRAMLEDKATEVSREKEVREFTKASSQVSSGEEDYDF